MPGEPIFPQGQGEKEPQEPRESGSERNDLFAEALATGFERAKIPEEITVNAAIDFLNKEGMLGLDLRYTEKNTDFDSIADAAMEIDIQAVLDAVLGHINEYIEQSSLSGKGVNRGELIDGKAFETMEKNLRGLVSAIYEMGEDILRYSRRDDPRVVHSDVPLYVVDMIRDAGLSEEVAIALKGVFARILGQCLNLHANLKPAISMHDRKFDLAIDRDHIPDQIEYQLREYSERIDAGLMLQHVLSEVPYVESAGVLGGDDQLQHRSLSFRINPKLSKKHAPKMRRYTPDVYDDYFRSHDIYVEIHPDFSGFSNETEGVDFAVLSYRPEHGRQARRDIPAVRYDNSSGSYRVLVGVALSATLKKEKTVSINGKDITFPQLQYSRVPEEDLSAFTAVPESVMTRFLSYNQR
jgi:hypothetical protein